MCVDVGADPATAASIMQKIANGGGNPLLTGEVPCPAPLEGQPQQGLPAIMDDPSRASPNSDKPDAKPDSKQTKPKGKKPTKPKPPVPWFRFGISFWFDRVFDVM